MRPCSRNRRLIACLALNTLEARKVAALRDHLALCEGCRRYWDEISSVTEGLASAAPASDLEASEFFLNRVAEKLNGVESSSVLEISAAWLRGSILNWRVVLPAIAVLVIALFAMVEPRNRPALSTSVPPTVQALSASSSESDLAPTLANYQTVAIQSLEKLSELLINQGNKSLPPAPVFSISSLELVSGPF